MVTKFSLTRGNWTRPAPQTLRRASNLGCVPLELPVHPYQMHEADRLWSSHRVHLAHVKPRRTHVHGRPYVLATAGSLWKWGKALNLGFQRRVAHHVEHQLTRTQIITWVVRPARLQGEASAVGRDLECVRVVSFLRSAGWARTIICSRVYLLSFHTGTP